ncbi:MAG: zf-HC2 domain-containing protein [Bacteroidetes bacterium]|nr:zf-HC2 domain-containing protein [Bacteroidota bacterium]
MTINCKDFHDKVTPFIDSELEKEKRTEVEEHAGRCTDCNKDLVIEKRVKKVVHDKTPLEKTPFELRYKIIKRLSNRLIFFRIKKFVIWLFKRPIMSIAAAAILIFIIYIGFFRDTSPDFVSENFNSNVFAQSIISFQNAKVHRYPSKTILNSDQEVVRQFLAANGFKGPVFPKTNWKLFGAGVNQLNSVTIAHLMYKCDDNIVYIYQAPCNAILREKKLFLPETLLKNVVDNDYNVIETDSCTAVLSIIDGTFMSFVMDKNSEYIVSDLIKSIGN